MTTQRERITREVIVKDYEYMTGEGANKKNARKDIIAVYYSPTTKEAREQKAAIDAKRAEDPTYQFMASEDLASRLAELRNVDTEKERGKILYEISLAELEDETSHNLNVIQSAIVEDISPKERPAK